MWEWFLMKDKNYRDIDHHPFPYFEADDKARRLSGLSIFGQNCSAVKKGIRKCSTVL
jgi:hypothetical protein